MLTAMRLPGSSHLRGTHFERKRDAVTVCGKMEAGCVSRSAADARLHEPCGLAVGHERGPDRRRFWQQLCVDGGAADRRVTTVAGSLEGLEGGKGYADCRGTVARFNWPTGVAIHALIPCMRGLLPFSSSSESVHPTKSAVTSSGNREYSTKHARVGAWFRGYCAGRCIPRGREGPVFVLHFAQCIGELPAKLTPLTSSMLVPPTSTSQ